MENPHFKNKNPRSSAAIDDPSPRAAHSSRQKRSAPG
jgi:hypothetical protein